MSQLLKIKENKWISKIGETVDHSLWHLEKESKSPHLLWTSKSDIIVSTATQPLLHPPSLRGSLLFTSRDSTTSHLATPSALWTAWTEPQPQTDLTPLPSLGDWDRSLDSNWQKAANMIGAFHVFLHVLIFWWANGHMRHHVTRIQKCLPYQLKDVNPESWAYKNLILL